MPDNETAMRNDLDDINVKIPALVAGAIPTTGASDATLLSKIDDMTALLEIIAEELDT